MDIFGIGPLEFFLILLVILIVLGPADMAKAGRSLGVFLRRLVTSEEWRMITQSAREFRHLPNRLIREAGVEEIKKELPDLRRDADIDGLNRDLRDWGQDVSSWTRQADQPGSESTPNSTPTIAPPRTPTQLKAAQSANSPAQTSPKNSTPARPSFNWDDPDILPEEEDTP
jgi:Sec-independent protein translocase protein TatA